MRNLTSNPTHIEERLNLWKAFVAEFGTDLIVVYKPQGSDHFITTTGNTPEATMKILEDVTQRVVDAYMAAQKIVAATKPTGVIAKSPKRKVPTRKPRYARNGEMTRAEWIKKHGHGLSYASKAAIEGHKKYLEAQRAKAAKPVQSLRNEARVSVGLEPEER
jgi:hypothetical protein